MTATTHITLWKNGLTAFARGAARFALAAGMLLLMAATAGAQGSASPRGSLRLGPQVGFFKARDADAARAMWGAALRLKVSEALGAEGSINYRVEEYQAGAVTVKSWPVMVTGLLYPIPMIYGALGIGWYNSSIDIGVMPGVTLASETHQDIGWHFGGGVELPLGSAATVVGDVRYVFLNYDFQNLPGSSGVKSDFYVIDVGLLFAL